MTEAMTPRCFGGHTRPYRHQAFQPTPQLIAPQVLGLVPQRVDGVVRSQRAVDKFLVEGPDGNGVEEGRGSGRSTAGLPYFG